MEGNANGGVDNNNPAADSGPLDVLAATHAAAATGKENRVEF